MEIQKRKTTIVAIVLFLFVVPMAAFFFVGRVNAAGQTTISGEDLNFFTKTIQKDNPDGTASLMQIDATGAAGNFRVDYAPAGLISSSSQLVESGDGFAKYLTDAVFEETLDVYTVTPPENIQTKHTDGSLTWFADRRYSIDLLNGYFDTTPGHPTAFIGQGSPGGTYWPYPVPSTTDVNRYLYSPETLTIGYDYWSINGVPGYIDSFRNLEINVGLNPLAEITLSNSLDQTQKILFGVDNWTVTSVIADKETQAPTPIGTYDVSFVGLDQNALSANLQDNVDPNSIVAEFAQEAQVQNALRAYSDAINTAEGFKATPVESVVQNMQVMTPTFNKVIYTGAYDGKSESVDVTIGCWVRPEIKQWIQHASVQCVGINSEGQVSTPLDIRTKNDYWTIFLGGAQITNTPTIAKRTVDRVCQYQANNYVAQFKVRVGVRFASTAMMEGLSSESILGLPNWQQGDIAVDLGIRGDTGMSIELLHQYGFGDFVSDVKTTVDIAADTIMQYVWIFIIVIVAIAVFMIIRRFTR